MTTNTMTSPTSIPQTTENKQNTRLPKLDSAKSNTASSVAGKQPTAKETKTSWWKFWAKKPAKTTTPAPQAMPKSNIKDTSSTDFKTPVRRDAASLAGQSTAERGGLNGLATANTPVAVERTAEDPMLVMYRDLKLSNVELNKTLREISEHLKVSTVSDERVVSALNKVDQSMAQVDRSFAESSSAIIASAEKSDQSIVKLSEHINNSSNSFKEVTKRIESNDLANRASVDKLQRRSNTIILGLGVVMTVAAITFSVLQIILS